MKDNNRAQNIDIENQEFIDTKGKQFDAACREYIAAYNQGKPSINNISIDQNAIAGVHKILDITTLLETNNTSKDDTSNNQTTKIILDENNIINHDNKAYVYYKLAYLDAAITRDFTNEETQAPIKNTIESYRQTIINERSKNNDAIAIADEVKYGTALMSDLIKNDTKYKDLKELSPQNISDIFKKSFNCNNNIDYSNFINNADNQKLINKNFQNIKQNKIGEEPEQQIFSKLMLYNIHNNKQEKLKESQISQYNELSKTFNLALRSIAKKYLEQSIPKEIQMSDITKDQKQHKLIANKDFLAAAYYIIKDTEALQGSEMWDTDVLFPNNKSYVYHKNKFMNDYFINQTKDNDKESVKQNINKIQNEEKQNRINISQPNKNKDKSAFDKMEEEYTQIDNNFLLLFRAAKDDLLDKNSNELLNDDKVLKNIFSKSLGCNIDSSHYDKFVEENKTLIQSAFQQHLEKNILIDDQYDDITEKNKSINKLHDEIIKYNIKDNEFFSLADATIKSLNTTKLTYIQRMNSFQKPRSYIKEFFQKIKDIFIKTKKEINPKNIIQALKQRDNNNNNRIDYKVNRQSLARNPRIR